MLIKIQSSAFKANENVRPAIIFDKGLNVVKGPDNFVNSIGKSTFLMVIDFVFGGEDYIGKLRNVHKYVGDHEINFTFSFDKEYHFCRSTETPSIIIVCNKDYVKTDTRWSVIDFNKWLKDKYEITNTLSFRQIVGRFFRIYNRENLDEQLPLRMHNDETKTKSIEALIRLFDMYGPIERSSQEAKESDDRKTAFSDAQKFEYIPKITKSTYNKNLKEIENLETTKNELADKSSKNLLDLDSEKASVILKLKNELSSFRKQRSKLYYKLNNLRKDNSAENKKYQADFSMLKEFFPNVNEERLQTVELFHKDITNIMSSELKEAEKKTWNLISLLTAQIEYLEEELNKVQNVSSISKIVLDEYAKTDKRLNALRNENESYDKLNELDEIQKHKKGELIKNTMLQATLLQEKINDEIVKLNTKIFDENFNSPRLTVISPTQYEFYTPDDDGTGTNYKGMVLLDLSCLSLTSLPSIIHDSILLKNISMASVEKIFELYNSFDKQIFVAFDNVSSYTEKTKEIINSNTILSLDDEKETLFGIRFGKN